MNKRELERERTRDSVGESERERESGRVREKRNEELLRKKKGFDEDRRRKGER